MTAPGHDIPSGAAAPATPRQRTADAILLAPSPASWAAVAADDLDATLADHAHCEKKAAASAVAFINAWPGDSALVAAMARLAVEEMEHFAEVHQILLERGVTLGPDRGDPYVQRLLEAARTGSREARKQDRLLVAALVEARSCERFRLLRDELARRGEDALAATFRRFETSEAGHATLFVGFARRIPGADERLAELARHEAEVVAALPVLPRIH